ncbi:ABC transporter ATP-binding protein [Thioalkalicoccus limnaeus]|uniref:ABC transporter ATP-binding protein n=1 Tax=Thioalkalicoccus limnaeus TaxID=120681 RepID=A0ABV4BJ33_9GAMM
MTRRKRPTTLPEALPGLGRILRRFWPYLRKHLLLIAGAMLALFASIGARLLEPWPLKFVIDRVVVDAPAGGASGWAWVDGLDPMTLLTYAALAMLLIVAARGVGSYLSTISFALVGNKVLTEVREDLYRHLQRLSLGFHHKAKTGDLTIRIIGDIGMLKETTVTAILPLLANVLVLGGMVGIMLWLNWQLALIALLPMPLLWLTSVKVGRRIQEVSRKQRQREGAMASTAAESMTAIRDIQALSLEKTFEKAFTSESRKSLKEGVKAKRLAAGLERTVDVLIGLSSALVLWFGARLVLAGALTPGDLIVFLAYLKNIFRPIREFAKYTGRLAKATAAGERVVDLLEQTAEIQDLPNARPAPPFVGAVQFDQVSFAYEPGQPVLNQIDLCVAPGERVAVVGPSGMGKSTLVSLLLRLHDPREGRVLVDGVDIREYRLDSLRAQISIVLSDSLLFAASVRDNIGYGAPDASTEQIERAARLANAHAFITALPNGYDTLLGERGVTLSSGQRQRIAIARAALRRGPILILDEPTSGLDRDNERAVIEALENLSRGRTVLMITHDLELAARADRILYLEAGGLSEQGAHAELLGRGGRYAALFRARAEQPRPSPVPETSNAVES